MKRGSKNFFISIILGTAREKRESEKAFNYVCEFAENFGFRIKKIDVRDYKLQRTIPPWDEKWKKYKELTETSEILKKSDGFIIVSPEYNHGYPGELKLFLDAFYKEYEGKPVLLCGVSSGGFGGARLIEHIKPVLIEFGMIVVSRAVYFYEIGNLFDKNGKIKEKNFDKRLKSAFDEFKDLLIKLRK